MIWLCAYECVRSKDNIGRRWPLRQERAQRWRGGLARRNGQSVGPMITHVVLIATECAAFLNFWSSCGKSRQQLRFERTAGRSKIIVLNRSIAGLLGFCTCIFALKPYVLTLWEAPCWSLHWYIVVNRRRQHWCAVSRNLMSWKVAY